MRLPPHRPHVRPPARPAVRPASGLLVALLLPALLALVAAPASADPPPDAPASEQGPASTSASTAEQALDQARTALAGEGGDAGAALRGLYRALPRLTAADAAAADEARALLARPTSGVDDPRGDGYGVPSVRRCSGPVCLHWVTTSGDAPPDRAWARTALGVVRDVVDLQVGELGYRAPLPDGRRGGDDRLDVYLADVGARGLFGYCAPEDPQDTTTDESGTASAYCVLDDDFAREQFGRAPLGSLRVTAAHELFHAVQLAYDADEDGWLQESSAAWMEERYADEVDDNRRYLTYGQLRRPDLSLDRFDVSGYAHYGNWIFWEHLTDRFGDDVVRDVWERASEDDVFSVQALRAVLRERGVRLPPVYARYAALNLVRAQAYDEGSTWPAPAPVARERVLRPVAAARAARADGGSARPAGVDLEVDHLASAAVVLRPGAPDERLERGRWALRVVVDGPRRATRPGAHLVVLRGDRSVVRRVPLDPEGVGAAGVPLSPRVTGVVVVVANGSSRYRCDVPDPAYACQGTPRDDDQVFDVSAELARR